MSQTKYIKVLIRLRDPLGKEVIGQIIIRDGFALSTFSNTKLAKQLYEEDKKNGLDVAFNEEHNAYIQKFGEKSKQEIIKIIKKELEQLGGELIIKS